MNKSATRIYMMTHKAFDVPEDAMYVPVYVGSAGASAGEASALFGYMRDDSGDNISDQNCYFSELTGMYWVWKNQKDIENVGICHYRRYLLNAQGYMFTEPEIISLLEEYDILTTKNLQLNVPYAEGFAFHHKPVYLEETGRVLYERYPLYYESFRQLVQEKHTYFGNMLICKKELYDEYCGWLFDILFEVQRRVPVVESDSYHRRIFGFLSEFLQYVWICCKHLRVCECMVGMLGEKAEVGEVKRQLARFFAAGDYAGAKEFFLEAKRQRPDLLMEASDITGELHLCMEVIAIAGLEQERYGRNLLDTVRDFKELMAYCNTLNRYAILPPDQETGGKEEEERRRWLQEKATPVAVRTARAVMQAAAEGIGKKTMAGYDSKDQEVKGDYAGTKEH
ncbi:MAG: DUF4422 domain-containing protein [Muribaculaceae bacterium]|nr:DUF4422 domain-containing protein [Muribaculaceae bacterium]